MTWLAIAVCILLGLIVGVLYWYNKKMVGHTYRVLVRGLERKGDYLSGLTEGKINVRIYSTDVTLIGKIVDVKISNPAHYPLIFLSGRDIVVNIPRKLRIIGVPIRAIGITYYAAIKGVFPITRNGQGTGFMKTVGDFTESRGCIIIGWVTESHEAEVNGIVWIINIRISNIQFNFFSRAL